jgi:hypothetical protein
MTGAVAAAYLLRSAVNGRRLAAWLARHRRPMMAAAPGGRGAWTAVNGRPVAAGFAADTTATGAPLARAISTPPPMLDELVRILRRHPSRPRPVAERVDDFIYSMF